MAIRYDRKKKEISQDIIYKIFLNRKQDNIKEIERRARLEKQRAEKKAEESRDKMADMAFFRMCSEQNILKPSDYFNELVEKWKEGYEAYTVVFKNDSKDIATYIKDKLHHFLMDYYESTKKETPKKSTKEDRMYEDMIEKARASLGKSAQEKYFNIT